MMGMVITCTLIFPGSWLPIKLSLNAADMPQYNQETYSNNITHTVQFQSIHHPSMTVTCLMKISPCHFA
jgi:hypothetical protein